MSDSKIADYIAQHPKMAGVLFTALLLLNSAGIAIASSGSTTAGP